jgi:hypothetical protein
MHVTIAALKRPAEVLPKAYKDYTDVFDEKEAGLLPDHGLYELAIKLMKGNIWTRICNAGGSASHDLPLVP